MQMVNNTTQHMGQPTFPFSRKNELPQVGLKSTTSRFPGKCSTIYMYTYIIVQQNLTLAELLLASDNAKQCEEECMEVLKTSHYTIIQRFPGLCYVYKVMADFTIMPTVVLFWCSSLCQLNIYMYTQNTYKMYCVFETKNRQVLGNSDGLQEPNK